MPRTTAMDLVDAQTALANDFVNQYLAQTERAPDDANRTQLREAIGLLIAEVMVTTIQNAPRR